MDSIESVSFRNKIERLVQGNVALPGALILEYPTICAIVDFILEARKKVRG